MDNTNSSPPIFSLRTISEKIKTGLILPTELVEVSLARIKKLNRSLNAFITVIGEDELYRQAKKAETEIRLGKYRGPLHGIPFSIKDIIRVRGIRCTAGSKILVDYIPKSSATVMQRLQKAGGILIGTNNLNEFASGITGINPFYGTSKNPWDRSRLSGGSSGGSAVAVSTGMSMFSIGTDTGGSIRVPASLCGAVGLKPTFGMISMQNIFPLAPTLDHVGFITRSVWDAAAILEILADRNRSRTSSKYRNIPSYTKIIEAYNPEGSRIAVPKEYFWNNMNSEIADLFCNFVEFLRSIKIVIVDDLTLHDTERYYDSWRNIRLAEASRVHSRWIRTRAVDYSPEVKDMLMQGKNISAVDYIHSLKVANDIKGEIFALFSNRKIDAIAVPTTIIAAPKISESLVNVGNDVVLETRKALLQNAIVFNTSGLPAISIPIGMTKESLPVGAQIIGPPFGEEIILKTAYSYERLNNDN